MWKNNDDGIAPTNTTTSRLLNNVTVEAKVGVAVNLHPFEAQIVKDYDKHLTD